MAITGGKGVFLDKDGTLVNNVPFNVLPDLIELAPGAIDGLTLLHEQGYRLVVVSNQPGVALGYFPEVGARWRLRATSMPAGPARNRARGLRVLSAPAHWLRAGVCTRMRLS